MRYCYYCGHSVPDDAHYCPACGKDLTSAPPTTSRNDAQGRNQQRTYQAANMQNKTNGNAQSPNTTGYASGKGIKKKKQSSLWGCTFIILLLALFAGGFLLTFNQLFDRDKLSPSNNILAPKDDTEEEKTAEEEKKQSTIEAKEKKENPEEALRRRVKDIYADVLNKEASYTNYVERYCTEELRTLILRAKSSDPNWIDFNLWTFSKNYNSPRVETIKIRDYTSFDAEIKVTIRPDADEERLHSVTLKMIKDEGTWLIDDFKNDGISIKMRARRAADDIDIQNETAKDTIEYF